METYLEAGPGDQRSASNEELDAEVSADLANVPPGPMPLATKFGTAAMLDLVDGDYCEELLSSRPQGNAVKEALEITLILLLHRKHPTYPPPTWMPAELLPHFDALQETRNGFLTSLAN